MIATGADPSSLPFDNPNLRNLVAEVSAKVFSFMCFSSNYANGNLVMIFNNAKNLS